MEKDFTKIRFIYAEATKHTSLIGGEKKFEITLDVNKSLNIPCDMDYEEVYGLIWYLSSKSKRETTINFTDDKERIRYIIRKLRENGFTENEGEPGVGYHHVTAEYSPFRKYNLDSDCPKIDSCLDLFVVDGDRRLFNKTSLSDRAIKGFSPQDTKLNKR